LQLSICIVLTFYIDGSILGIYYFNLTVYIFFIVELLNKIIIKTKVK